MTTLIPDNLTPLERAWAVMAERQTDFTAQPIAARNAELADAWLVWLRDTAGRAPVTVYNYASVVAKYLDLAVGDRPLDAVTPEEVEVWLLRPRERRAKGKVGSPATRARNVAVLKSWYGWLHARGLVARNLGDLLVAPTVHNRQPKAIPDSTWIQVWGSNLEDHDRAMLGLGFWLGLRRAELAELRPEHWDLERRRIVGLQRKGGGDDIIPYGEVFDVWSSFAPNLGAGFTVELFERTLGARLRASQDVLTLRDPDTVNQRLKRILGRLGLDGAFTPHHLRHSFVTNLLRCGMPIELVADLANHSNISITMRYVKGGGGRVSEWASGQQLKLSDYGPGRG